MKKKKTHTHESVSNYFITQRCELLENHYFNSRTPMRCRCVCGNVFFINFSNFKQGSRCRQCFINKEKLSLESVQSYFKEHGCELLVTEYINCNTPMLYRCVCGTVAKTSWSNFRKGRRCKECGKEHVSGPNNYQWISDREQYKRNRSFSTRCRSMLTESLKSTGRRKCAKKEEMLGYTVKELQIYIESHPNWSAINKEPWEIDHIFPIKAFIDHGIMDVKIINRLDNLQPLSAKVNSSKKDKYDPVLFRAWLTSINVTYDH